MLELEQVFEGNKYLFIYYIHAQDYFRGALGDVGPLRSAAPGEAVPKFLLELRSHLS